MMDRQGGSGSSSGGGGEARGGGRITEVGEDLSSVVVTREVSDSDSQIQLSIGTWA